MTVRHPFSRRQVARAFGAALRGARKERGVSQEELAGIADFDRTYPSLLERGLRTPTLTVIFSLAEALNVEPEWLVTQTELWLREHRPESDRPIPARAP